MQDRILGGAAAAAMTVNWDRLTALVDEASAKQRTKLGKINIIVAGRTGVGPASATGPASNAAGAGSTSSVGSTGSAGSSFSVGSNVSLGSTNNATGHLDPVGATGSGSGGHDALLNGGPPSPAARDLGRALILNDMRQLGLIGPPLTDSQVNALIGQHWR
jgi:hypothetical protein